MSWWEKVRRGSGREPALEKRQPGVPDLSVRICGQWGSEEGDLYGAKLPSTSTRSVPLLVPVSPKLSVKHLGLLFMQVHLHAGAFKRSWQPPPVRRTTPCWECVHFPNTCGEQPVSWLGFLLSQGTKQSCHHGHDSQVTHWLLCALFRTPKETTNFNGRHLQQRLLQKSCSCENDPDACDSCNSTLFLPRIYGQSWASTDWPPGWSRTEDRDAP